MSDITIDTNSEAAADLKDLAPGDTATLEITVEANEDGTLTATLDSCNCAAEDDGEEVAEEAPAKESGSKEPSVAILALDLKSKK